MSEKTNLRGVVVVEFDKKEEKGGRRGRKMQIAYEGI